jgi:hypothetical protein
MSREIFMSVPAGWDDDSASGTVMLAGEVDEHDGSVSRLRLVYWVAGGDEDAGLAHQPRPSQVAPRHGPVMRPDDPRLRAAPPALGDWRCDECERLVVALVGHTGRRCSDGHAPVAMRLCVGRAR